MRIASIAFLGTGTSLHPAEPAVQDYEPCGCSDLKRQTVGVGLGIGRLTRGARLRLVRPPTLQAQARALILLAPVRVEPGQLLHEPQQLPIRTYETVTVTPLPQGQKPEGVLGQTRSLVTIETTITYSTRLEVGGKRDQALEGNLSCDFLPRGFKKIDRRKVFLTGRLQAGIRREGEHP